MNRTPIPSANIACASFTSGLPWRTLRRSTTAPPTDPGSRSAGACRQPPSARTERATPPGTRRFAPASMSTVGVPPGTGSGVAIAGRATPEMRPIRRSADAIVAPVLPAETIAEARPSLTASAARTSVRVLLRKDAPSRRVLVHPDDLVGLDDLEIPGVTSEPSLDRRARRARLRRARRVPRPRSRREPCRPRGSRLRPK